MPPLQAPQIGFLPSSTTTQHPPLSLPPLLPPTTATTHRNHHQHRQSVDRSSCLDPPPPPHLTCETFCSTHPKTRTDPGQPCTPRNKHGSRMCRGWCAARAGLYIVTKQKVSASPKFSSPTIAFGRMRRMRRMRSTPLLLPLSPPRHRRPGRTAQLDRDARPPSCPSPPLSPASHEFGCVFCGTVCALTTGKKKDFCAYTTGSRCPGRHIGSTSIGC